MKRFKVKRVYNIRWSGKWPTSNKHWAVLKLKRFLFVTRWKLISRNNEKLMYDDKKDANRTLKILRKHYARKDNDW